MTDTNRISATDGAPAGGNGNGNSGGTGHGPAALPARLDYAARGVAKPAFSWRWPAIIIGVLGLHFVLMTAVAVIASRDRSFAVTPNYYQKAIDWDKSQAELRASERLGWTLAIEPAPAVDPLGKRPVTLRLAQQDGTPIAGAQVEIEYFHHTHAHQVRRATIALDAAGTATQVLPMRYEGFYDFHVTARQADRRFVSTVTQYVSNAGKGVR